MLQQDIFLSICIPVCVVGARIWFGFSKIICFAEITVTDSIRQLWAIKKAVFGDISFMQRWDPPVSWEYDSVEQHRNDSFPTCYVMLSTRNDFDIMLVTGGSQTEVFLLWTWRQWKDPWRAWGAKVTLLLTWASKFSACAATTQFFVSWTSISVLFQPAVSAVFQYWWETIQPQITASAKDQFTNPPSKVHAKEYSDIPVHNTIAGSSRKLCY